MIRTLADSFPAALFVLGVACLAALAVLVVAKLEKRG